MKKYWARLLRQNLLPDPAQLSKDKLWRREHRNDFFTPENLIVVIKTDYKHYTFGGPVYSATVNLGENKIGVTFVPPKYRGVQRYTIRWGKIKELDLRFLQDRKPA